VKSVQKWLQHSFGTFMYFLEAFRTASLSASLLRVIHTSAQTELKRKGAPLSNCNGCLSHLLRYTTCLVERER